MSKRYRVVHIVTSYVTAPDGDTADALVQARVRNDTFPDRVEGVDGDIESVEVEWQADEIVG